MRDRVTRSRVVDLGLTLTLEVEGLWCVCVCACVCVSMRVCRAVLFVVGEVLVCERQCRATGRLWTSDSRPLIGLPSSIKYIVRVRYIVAPNDPDPPHRWRKRKTLVLSYLIVVGNLERKTDAIPNNTLG